ARLLELGDVGTRDEGLVAFAAQDDDADRAVLVELARGARDGFPHRARDRVAARQVIEDQVPKRSVALDADASCHGRRRSTRRPAARDASSITAPRPRA